MFHDEMKPAIPPSPGPWRYLRHDGVIAYDDDLGAREIAWNDADYMLAAAAPDLLEALKAMAGDYKATAESGDCGFYKAEEQPIYRAAMAAIAKAEGRA